jgi:ABC-type multidrug transport system ATPase subunit
MDTILEVQHLSKQFTEVRAVDDLSFSVHKGEVYGFLGQNGAGKSTTLRMILTLIKPTSGSIRVFGEDLVKGRLSILGQIGAIIEKPDLYQYLTALQNLQIMALLSGINPTNTALMNQLERVGLQDRARSRIKTFSQGMKQRLGIACALMHNPQLIILDEPTNGLDPQGIADIRNLILHLSRNEGKTVIVSSHLLSEIELIADSMLIIDRGKKIAEGKAAQLLDPADTLVQVRTTNDNATLGQLQNSSWSSSLQEDRKGVWLKMHRQKVPQLSRDLVNMQVEILALEPKHSLEDFFLSLTNANRHVATHKN